MSAGAALSARFFELAVRPTLDEVLEGAGYLAARLGSGSDVLGYDALSTDHDFGCRLTVLVDDEHQPRLALIDEALQRRLPDEVDGWPTRFATTWDGAVGHKVDLGTVHGFATSRLGFDLRTPLRPAEWLCLTGQSVLEVTGGPVFHDTTRSYAEIARQLAWYPDDVWRSVLAAGWARLGEELPLVGRTGTDIGRVAKGGVSPAELRGMLLLRRTELEAELTEAGARLERVESQIRRLENEMSDQSHRSDRTVDVATKRLPAVHLAVASGVSPTFASADIGPVIQPLYPTLLEALVAAGIDIVSSPTANYDDAVDGGIGVHAGFPVDAAVASLPGFEIVDLPAVELAATAIHLGDMATVDVDTVAPLLGWIKANGFRTTGYSREVYLHCPEDLSQWRTELQFPIEAEVAQP